MNAQELIDLNTSIMGFSQKFKDLAGTKRPTAGASINATTVSGLTSAQLLTQLLATLNTHIADHNNPHADSATKMGCPSKADLDARLAGFLSQGVVPYSSVGTHDVPVDYEAVGFIFNFQAVPVTMQGRDYVIPAQSIDIRNWGPTANNTFWVSVRMVNGSPAYVFEQSLPAESAVNIFIGTCRTNASGIQTSNFMGVVRLGFWRPSRTSKGSAIPVSGGNPTTTDKLLW